MTRPSLLSVLFEAARPRTLPAGLAPVLFGTAFAVAEGLATSNGPIGRVEYVDVRQSMRNGGGPACLRLRAVLTDAELDAANPAQRFTPGLHTTLADWITRRYRDRLAPADLADPLLLTESREALDELTRILDLGGNFYPFQR